MLGVSSLSIIALTFSQRVERTAEVRTTCGVGALFQVSNFGALMRQLTCEAAVESAGRVLR